MFTHDFYKVHKENHCERKRANNLMHVLYYIM